MGCCQIYRPPRTPTLLACISEGERISYSVRQAERLTDTTGNENGYKTTGCHIWGYSGIEDELGK